MNLQVVFFHASSPQQNTQNFNNPFNNTWIKAIILYQPLNKFGYARVLDGQNNLIFQTSLDFSGFQQYFMHYMPDQSTINNNLWLTFQHGVYYNYNSCSKQKYGMFHYSNDEILSLDQIQTYVFDNYLNYKGYFPISYFPFKRQANNLISNQQLSFQRYKNIYFPNLSEAINGQNYLQDSYDTTFVLKNGVYVEDFNSGQFIQFPSLPSQYQFMISFIFYYNQITANGIVLFTTDTNSFTIKAIQNSQFLITLGGDPNNYTFNLANSGCRYTFAFSVQGTTLLSKIAYFQDNQYIGVINSNSLINSFSKIYMGGQQQPNDEFQIQDLYLIPNSDFKTDYPSEPSLVPKSLTKMTLKLTLDQANLICYQSIIYENSILNQWIFVGFGYKISTLSAYLVYQDKYGITQYQTLTCSGQAVGTETNSFQVCIGCLITNNNKYSSFIGKVKNVKLIEGFNDYPNINQYIYFDQDVMDLSASNINYLKVYSLKDLFTYSLPGMQFACPNGYYFLEGICVSSCNNVIRSQTALGSYSPLFTNANSLSCEICPQNCLTCTSSSICTSCNAGFVVDQNSNLCISCSQSTYYDSTSHQCVQTCTSIVDLMNKQCVTQTNPQILNSFLFFSSQIITYNEGFQILDSSSVAQLDSFSKCQGNNPYSFFMFYGGESVSSTQTIQKTWQNLPNNYSKQITFTVVLFNFSSLTDLQVNFNGKVSSQTSMVLINQNPNICTSSNQAQTYQGISFTFIFYTQICSNNGVQTLQFPTDIQIIPSLGLNYLQNTLQGYQGQNLEIDILKFKLPSNQLSFLNRMRLGLFQMEGIENSPSTLQHISQKKTNFYTKSLGTDFVPFTQKISSDNQDMTKNEIKNQVKKIKIDTQPLTKQKVEFNEKIEEVQIIEADQAPTYSSSEKGFVNQQNEFCIKNKIECENSNKTERSCSKNENQARSGQNFDNFLQKNFLVRLMVLHDFFSIFFIYDPNLSRPLRFQIIYLQSNRNQNSPIFLDFPLQKERNINGNINYFENNYSSVLLLQTNLNDPGYSDCVQGSSDERPLVGYSLNSLLGLTNPGQYNYKAFSASIWFKPKFNIQKWSNNFGILSDITAKLIDNRNGFTLNNMSQLQVFSFQAGFFDISQINYATQNYNNNFYNNTWMKAILIYQPLNKKGYARVLSSSNQIIFDASMDFSSLQAYFIHYMPSSPNINNNAWLTFQHGVYYNYNSCSKQKYAMFHYSNDEAFSVDQILAYAFDNYLNNKGYFPTSYFPLKRQINNLIDNQLISFQRYKNIYSPNLSEAINGQNNIQDAQDINFLLNNGVYIADFNSGQYIQYPSLLSPYQFMISFVIYYNQITANGITLFTTDTNSFTIKATQSSQLLINFSNNPNTYSFNLAQNGSRHTIAFSVYGITLSTKIAYYQDNIQIGTTLLLNTLLTPFSKIYIGGYQQTNDRFQIQDLYLIPNSDFQVNYPTEPAFNPSNCNFFYSFNLNLSYCLSCQANYQLNYYGQCVQISYQSTTQQISFTYSYIGSNFISIVDAPLDPTIKQLIYDYQISNNQFDFLILGYYQLTQWQTGQLFTSLAYLQVIQPNQYYFLNIYLESVTKITLKLTLDQANLICYQSIIYENSILNQWIFAGFGYKTSTSSAYLVYQDKYAITKYQTLPCQGQSVGADTKSFQICIGCLITNNNKYSQFIGKVKNIKLIEGFNDYPNINQYIYFDPEVMDLSASNINYLKIYNLKDLFTYSLPGMQFACPNGYYFLEGICVSSCSNVARSQTALGSYNPFFVNTNSQSCEICPQNCLTCLSSSICTSCNSGFVVDQSSNLCLSCSQNTYYDSISHQCVQTCTNIADLMNRQCVTQSDPYNLNSFLFFSSQILTYNEGFQILDSSSVAQQDTFFKCQGNNPYSFFMFYGGESVYSSQTIQKIWSNLPNNYSKEITFVVVLFNFSSLADLQVTLNGKIPSQTSMILINQNPNICTSSNQAQTQAIYQLSYQLTDNQNTLQLKIKYKQNGIGIRNIQLSVKKCHSSCNSCQNGPNPWNCITCQRNNNIINSSQCVCASNEYFQSNQCYSSPCYKCVQCSIKNCLRCQDETGDCLICNQGYSLLQGKCVSICSEQEYLASYSINSQISVCYQQNIQAIDHFQNNKIINNLEFWQLSVDYISQSGLISCLNQNFLPNLGNVNGVQDFITLQMVLNSFKSKYRGILFDINLVVIDNISLNSDFIIFQFAGTEVKRVTYQGKSAPISTCVNPNYQEQIYEILLPIYKQDVINEPLCTQYSFGQEYSGSQCSSCNSNSSMGLNNQCLCNDGYYFFYNSSILDGQCVQCNPICSKCIGPSYYDCLVCSTNYYYQISSKMCVIQCQSNEFIFINSALAQNECHQCDDSCLTCQGPNKTDCQICQDNYYLDSVSKLCVPQCQSNQYQSNNPANGQIMCMPCDQTCLSCKGSGKEKCVTCIKGQFSYQGDCYDACPNNYQGNQKTNTCDLCQKFIVPQCQSCHITCNQCIYGKKDDNSCTSCYETKQLLNVISKQSTPTSEFCNEIFDSNTYLLIGSTSTCRISGSQILVDLGNDSTLMENNEVILNGNILSFKDYKTNITTFYKTTVSQLSPGVSQLIFNYKDAESSCNDIAINLSQILNDAQRGLLSINWSIVNFSTPPSQQSLESINQILQQANQNNQTTLNITKYLVPVDSSLKLQVAYKFKVNQNNVQTFLIYYQMGKQIQAYYMQSLQPPFYRYMAISYTFIFSTQICSNKGPQTQSFPINIQITSSNELNYLQKTLQRFQGQNLEIDILKYTLPSNKLSFLNVPVTLIQTPHSLNLMSPNRFTQNRQEQKIVLQTLEKDSVYSQQRKQKRKRLSLIQMKKVDNSPSTEQKIQQKIKIAHINNQRRDSLPFTYKTSSDNNEDLNINDDANKIKKIKIDSTPQINQKAGFTEKIEELQMLEANQVPTQSSSEKAFINEQNENSLKNQIEDVNSKQMKKGNQNFIRRGQNFDNFLSKNFFVRMMILHDFISIFFFYNEELSRPIRFQMVYMEKGILKAISTISKILIILIYNYIILSVISGSEPSEANQFLELFLIATGMDFVVYQCLMAIFKNILINIITSTNTTNCLILYIFNKLELQDMIEKL
ncbi:hypothetical protein ABPG73_006262 [Tetrahymena malaccensis]